MKKLFVLFVTALCFSLSANAKISTAQTVNDSLLHLKQAVKSTDHDNYDSFLKVIDLTQRSVKELISSAKDADDIDITVAEQISDCYKSIADKNAKYFKNKIQVLHRQRDELIRQKDANITQIASLDKEMSSYRVQRTSVEQRLAQLSRDEDDIKNDIKSYLNQLNDINNAIRECNEYCWVPFYNIHLYVKATEAEKKRPEITRLFNEANGILTGLLNEKADYTSQLKNCNFKLNSIQQRLDSYNKNQNECVNKINAIKEEIVKTDNIAVYFSNQVSVFRYIANNPNEMADELSKARNELKKLGKF